MDEDVISQIRKQFKLMGNLDPIVDEIISECLPSFFDCEIWVPALGWVTIQIPWQAMGLFDQEPILRKDLSDTSFMSPKGTRVEIFDMDSKPNRKKITKYGIDLTTPVGGVYVRCTMEPDYSRFEIYQAIGPFHRIILYSEICTRTKSLRGKYRGKLSMGVCGRLIYRGQSLDHIAINHKFTDRLYITREESIEVVDKTFLKALVDVFF
jgi:hypothetical protein